MRRGCKYEEEDCARSQVEQEISAKVQVQKHVARRCMKAYTEDGRYMKRDGATLRQGVSTRARPRYEQE